MRTEFSKSDFRYKNFCRMLRQDYCKKCVHRTHCTFFKESDLKFVSPNDMIADYGTLQTFQKEYHHEDCGISEEQKEKLNELFEEYRKNLSDVAGFDVDPNEPDHYKCYGD